MREAFLEAVLRDPADDTPRLVFADWLAEHGEEAYGEFIRVQCELARYRIGSISIGPGMDKQIERLIELRRRERDLLSDHWPKWLHQAFDGLAHDIGVSTRGDNEFGVSMYSTAKGELGHFDCSFRRGFVECLTLPFAVWMVRADAMTASQSIREVTLTDVVVPLRRVRQGEVDHFRFAGGARRWSYYELDLDDTDPRRHGAPWRRLVAERLLAAEWPWIAFTLPPAPT